jgi:hypothetical protein
MNYRTAPLLFFIVKGYHLEKSIKPFSASKQQLNWICGLNWQSPANDGLRTFNSIDFAASPELRARSYELQATSYELQAKSYELQATSYELQVTSYKIRDESYELRDTRYKIAPAPADESTVQPCTVVWWYGTDLHRTLMELSWISDIFTGWWWYSRSTVPYHRKPAQVRFLNWSYGDIICWIKW